MGVRFFLRPIPNFPTSIFHIFARNVHASNDLEIKYLTVQWAKTSIRRKEGHKNKGTACAVYSCCVQVSLVELTELRCTGLSGGRELDRKLTHYSTIVVQNDGAYDKQQTGEHKVQRTLAGGNQTRSDRRSQSWSGVSSSIFGRSILKLEYSIWTSAPFFKSFYLTYAKASRCRHNAVCTICRDSAADRLHCPQ